MVTTHTRIINEKQPPKPNVALLPNRIIFFPRLTANSPLPSASTSLFFFFPNNPSGLNFFKGLTLSKTWSVGLLEVLFVAFSSLVSWDISLFVVDCCTPCLALAILVWLVKLFFLKMFCFKLFCFRLFCCVLKLWLAKLGLYPLLNWLLFFGNAEKFPCLGILLSFFDYFVCFEDCNRC